MKKTRLSPLLAVTALSLLTVAAGAADQEKKSKDPIPPSAIKGSPQDLNVTTALPDSPEKPDAATRTVTTGTATTTTTGIMPSAAAGTPSNAGPAAAGAATDAPGTRIVIPVNGGAGAVPTVPDSGGVVRSTGAGSGDASTSATPGAISGRPAVGASASGIGTATTGDTPGGTGPNPVRSKAPAPIPGTSSSATRGGESSAILGR